MWNLQVLATILTLSFVVIVTPVSAVDIQSVKEAKCVGVPTFKGLDMDWVNSLVVSTKEFYYPLWSKYELYRISEDLLGVDASQISQESIDTSCIYAKGKGKPGTSKAYGFGGKSVGYKYTMDDHGNFVTTILDENGESTTGTSMISVTTLTDNKTFMVTVQCWENGERTWAVGSLLKKFDEETKQLILDHVKSLGFNMKNLYEMKYDKCAKGSGNDEL